MMNMIRYMRFSSVTRMPMYRLWLSACLALFPVGWGMAAPTPQGDGDETGRWVAEVPGEGVYRIGAILLDKPRRRFTVSGRIIRLEAPLEFIAVSRHGGKAYESLIELDSNAIEFNLACLLIGLDPTHSDASDFHFDERPVSGDPVVVEVSWERDGRRITKPVAALLNRKADDVPGKSTWVYTGSVLTPEGIYLADADGTVIGFAHDPSSIIEHRSGLGLNDYGAIAADPESAPPVGTPIELTVRRPDRSGAARRDRRRDP